ncbi:hypothetical protein QWI17_17565 [Gilvimarinus sp. SDUM040013]|uniref:DUF4136 domain-containing protein n=1 Tax=Gilvimarinus gilvus TaxID=3058038 RepID=A0ABU4RZ82_9GAMM|nr:hypothetical protein [Gilvimarinus sp. SDUM040013]MDO3387656.1 hypothetical protein [Gilvimarinus sp. SDUM040013]MDX6848903.1 hypothetical protein [Gilvimarinus sp. SDUM040013]
MALVLRINFIALLVWLTSACTTQTEPRQHPNYTSSFISVAEPGFKLQVGDRLAWRAPIEVIAEQGNTLKPQTLSHLKRRLESDIAAQGLIMTANQSADYLLDAVIIVDELMSKEQLVERFDIAPALYNSGEYDAGTMVLRFIHPYSQRTLWRGAMEVFTDPSMSTKERLQKIDHAVDSFSRGFAP